MLQKDHRISYLVNFMTLSTLYIVWMAPIGVYCLLQIVCKVCLMQQLLFFFSNT